MAEGKIAMLSYALNEGGYIMGLAKELLAKTTPRDFIKERLDNAAQKIVDKGAELSDVDLYNLCLINKERDEIAELED